jgi:hypothetical protein
MTPARLIYVKILVVFKNLLLRYIFLLDQISATSRFLFLKYVCDSFGQAKYGYTLALGKKRIMADVPSSWNATRSTVNDLSIHMVKLSFLIANSSASSTCDVKRLLELDVQMLHPKWVYG